MLAPPDRPSVPEMLKPPVPPPPPIDWAMKPAASVPVAVHAAGRDIAVEGRIDGSTHAAIAAVAADADCGGHGHAVTRRSRDADAEAALAAAAADRLRDEAGRIVALGFDVAAEIDIHRPAEAAASAASAKAHREGCAEAEARRESGSCDRSATGAAAAADALRENAFGKSPVVRMVDVAVEVDGPALATRSAAAADGDAGRAERAGRSLDREAA